MSPEEQRRGGGIFNRLDKDNSGTIESSELDLVVSPQDRTQMMLLLDTDGNNEIAMDEFLVYLAVKKKEKGPHKFTHFLGYLERGQCVNTRARPRDAGFPGLQEGEF